MPGVGLSDAVGEVHARRGAGHQDRLQALQLLEPGSNLSPSGQGHHPLVQQQAQGGGAGEEQDQQ